MSDLEKGDKGSASSTTEKVSRPDQKRRSNCLLGFGRLISFLTAVCALLCAVAHGMALMVGEGSAQVLAYSLQVVFLQSLQTYLYGELLIWQHVLQGVQALTQQVLRLYGIGFAILVGKGPLQICMKR